MSDENKSIVRGDNMIVVRKMEPNEASAVKKVGQRTFGIVESLFVTRPKEAMIALLDDKIVGGIIIKYIVSNGKKIGYYDGAFIDPDYQGLGIGNKLYAETTKYLWEQGCDALCALVKDDNVGSWKLFLNNGFSQTSIKEVIHQLGLGTVLKTYFTTPFFIANGMEFYLAVKEQSVQSKVCKTGSQIGLYLLGNFLLMLPTLFMGRSNFGLFISAYMVLLIGGVLFSYIGTLFSKRQWYFRMNSGGAVLAAFINLSGAFPMIGSWYPEKYENTQAFKKDMGISALWEWLFVLGVTFIALLLEPLYFRYMAQIGGVFLIFRILIFYPFESFGGRRVYLWNKGWYGVLTVLSILLLMFS